MECVDHASEILIKSMSYKFSLYCHGDPLWTKEEFEAEGFLVYHQLKNGKGQFDSSRNIPFVAYFSTCLRNRFCRILKDSKIRQATLVSSDTDVEISEDHMAPDRTVCDCFPLTIEQDIALTDTSQQDVAKLLSFFSDLPDDFEVTSTHVGTESRFWYSVRKRLGWKRWRISRAREQLRKTLEDSVEH